MWYTQVGIMYEWIAIMCSGFILHTASSNLLIRVQHLSLS